MIRQEDRFDDMTIPEPNTGCIFWLGPAGPLGYGLIWVATKKKQMIAHRFAYERRYGPIPKGMLACHRCDTPACVNPDHIFIGTHRDNSLDMVAKGRNHRPKLLPKEPLDELTEHHYNDSMTKRAPNAPKKQRQISSGELSRSTSRIIRDAQAGRRTVITHYNIVVAAVVSADDLKTLEAVK